MSSSEHTNLSTPVFKTHYNTISSKTKPLSHWGQTEGQEDSIVNCSG